MLVVAEVALSLMLLASAGLLIRTLERAAARQPRLQHRARRSRCSCCCRRRATTTPASMIAFYRRLHDRARPRLPAVTRGGRVDDAADDRQRHRHGLRAGRPRGRSGGAHVGVVLRRQPGLLLDARHPDRARPRLHASATTRTPPAVVIINETMAAKYWPGEDPIGKRVTLSYNNTPPREIVGIAADVKQTNLTDAVTAADVHAVRAGAVAVHSRGGADAGGAGSGGGLAAAGAGASGSGTGGRRNPDLRSIRGAVDRDAAVHRAAARRLRRARAAAGRLRPLRRDGVFGRAAQPRDRHPHGARRAGGRRAVAGREPGGAARRGRAGDGPGRRVRGRRACSTACCSASAPAIR